MDYVQFVQHIIQSGLNIESISFHKIAGSEERCVVPEMISTGHLIQPPVEVVPHFRMFIRKFMQLQLRMNTVHNAVPNCERTHFGFDISFRNWGIVKLVKVLAQEVREGTDK